MNGKLENAMAEILIKAAETAETAAGFVVEQTPEVAQQCLRWNFVAAACSMGIGVLVLMGGIAAIAIACRVERSVCGACGAWKEEATGAFVVGLIVSVVGIGMVVSSGATVLQIWLAPKVYLIEYAAKLAK